MKRLIVKKRDQWQSHMEELGFTFHTTDDTYWNEGVCYEFSAQEIDEIERVTQLLHEMCIEAVKAVLNNNLFRRLHIPESYEHYIRNTLKQQQLSIYGRFDFSFDNNGNPCLLEYNADTPTSLLESSVVQWVWLEEMFPKYDQFNSIHEKLLEAFSAIARETASGVPMYFSCVKDYEEDLVTVQYLQDVAIQAGLDGRHVFIEDIGYNAEGGKFYDLHGEVIEQMFKLYPWEWLLADAFGSHVLKGAMRLYEPPWKMILSNKAILAILWEMYPNHPNLIPTYHGARSLRGNYVKKPIFSREGANVSIFRDGDMIDATEGTYGQEGFVYQEIRALPEFSGNHAVVGSWVINGQPAGIGVREDNSAVTKNTSRFVPHYFKP
ncbi:glutathionylspermidine synthase family protein [Candidatus Magnetomonas plexicatena]|uniref:glutathionylspermidine synthase family protein n=1 Tax=Candidatus Magnetomonas plexicatena TaxID=2552947 RepID=UPI001C742F48|nr:glutathionylspermidine synthase family protein [Nitrospirales bacterium LBB_01]